MITDGVRGGRSTSYLSCTCDERASSSDSCRAASQDAAYDPRRRSLRPKTPGRTQERRKRRGALLRARDAPDPRIERELRTGLHRGNREVELEPFGLASQREPDGMKERLSLLAGPLAHASRGGAEGLLVMQARARRQLLGKRGNHGMRSGLRHFRANGGIGD